MANIVELTENRQTSEFYPTPAELAKRMLEKVDWYKVNTILEPSAGKGDILKEIARAIQRSDRRNSKDLEIDAIEIDNNLRSILKYNFSGEAKNKLRSEMKEATKDYANHYQQHWQTGRYYYFDGKERKDKDFPESVQVQLEKINDELKGFFPDGIRIVHDDFLTYTNYKKYDLIIMNPPFSNGDMHLLKALKMQKNGGSIVCLLNAETIRNPYTPTRKHLVQLLDGYNAEIEYISNAFSDAERRADVDVALIRVDIPNSVDEKESIFDRLAKAQKYEEPDISESTELEVTDFIQALVNRYRVEIESGIELIKTYWRMRPYIRSSLDPKREYYYDTPIIQLTDGDNHEMTINRYVRKVRLKYWQGLLTNDKFIGRLTSKLQQEYHERINHYAEYDFSMFNIQTLLVEMQAQIKGGIEDEIMKTYDRLTEEHAYYPECAKNRHYYDGWKTNKAWKIDKKSILPIYGVFSSYDKRPRVYEAAHVLSDIERVLNYFDGNMTADVDLSSTLDCYFRANITQNVKLKYFDVTFYKKGTVHIKFTCPELIDRFNIYAAQNRRWLPPCYGKKKYADMTEEEQAVINEFQGEQAYNKVMSRPDYFLASPVKETGMLLLDVSTQDEQRAV